MVDSDIAQPPAPSDPADPEESARALGARIRALRKRRGLTLAQAASEAGLSHSFLSQVERGLERLSMASLFRIARALGTTQQALLTDRPDRRTDAPQVFRADAASTVDAGAGVVSVLAKDRARFVPMIFSGTFVDDGMSWEHDEEEFVYVLEGELVVILDDEEYLLAQGDSIYYDGGAPHRWRTPGGGVCRVLVVKEQRHDVP